MHAAFRGELGCLQLLIENGAKVECEVRQSERSVSSGTFYHLLSFRIS